MIPPFPNAVSPKTSSRSELRGMNRAAENAVRQSSVLHDDSSAGRGSFKPLQEVPRVAVKDGQRTHGQLPSFGLRDIKDARSLEMKRLILIPGVSAVPLVLDGTPHRARRGDADCLLVLLDLPAQLRITYDA